MAYIGRGTDTISNVEVLDNLTFNGSASYTLQKSSTNFVPSSANNLLISISGVVQQGNFSVSGSTITFDTTVASSDTCDWILHYGTGLITTVADGAITEAKLGNNAVTASKIDSSVALGKIGQVVSATDTTIRTSTSTSFTDASNTCSLTITPSSTSSKILLVCSFSGGLNTADKRASYTWFRDGTNLGDATEGLRSHEIQGTGNYSIESNMTVDWIDSPNTTSSITYTLQFKAETGTVYFNNRGYAQSYAMEVLA